VAEEEEEEAGQKKPNGPNKSAEPTSGMWVFRSREEGSLRGSQVSSSGERSCGFLCPALFTSLLLFPCFNPSSLMSLHLFSAPNCPSYSSSSRHSSSTYLYFFPPSFPTLFFSSSSSSPPPPPLPHCHGCRASQRREGDAEVRQEKRKTDDWRGNRNERNSEREERMWKSNI